MNINSVNLLPEQVIHIPYRNDILQLALILHVEHAQKVVMRILLEKATLERRS